MSKAQDEHLARTRSRMELTGFSIISFSSLQFISFPKKPKDHSWAVHMAQAASEPVRPSGHAKDLCNLGTSGDIHG